MSDGITRSVHGRLNSITVNLDGTKYCFVSFASPLIVLVPINMCHEFPYETCKSNQDPAMP